MELRISIIVFSLFVALSCIHSPEMALDSEKHDKFSIDQRCLKGLTESERQNLRTQIETAFTEGDRCLTGLGKQASKKLLAELLKIRDRFPPVEIHCPADMPENKWADTGMLLAEDTSVPEIRLNQKKLKEELQWSNSHFIAGTVFHEMIHHAGYDHTTTIDYAFACEYHCFPTEEFWIKSLTQEGKRVAKEICEGKFQDPFDFHYLRNINNLIYIGDGYLRGRIDKLDYAISQRPSVRQLKFLFGAHLLLSHAADVGKEFLFLLEKEYAKEKLNIDERRYLESANDPNLQKELKTIGPDAKDLAKAFAQYFRGDTVSAAKTARSVEAKWSPFPHGDYMVLTAFLTK